MAENERNDKTATKKDVAEFLGVTTRTVENQMKAGIIPYWKVGRLCRFDMVQVRAALNERCGKNGGGR